MRPWRICICAVVLGGGALLLFRESSTRGVGRASGVGPDDLFFSRLSVVQDDADGDLDPKRCQPERKIGFAKTHKTAST